jgi:1-acyl-sn-glycerol-3-phosphate acyltransferase
MSVVSWLNRPGPVRWIWRPGYELFYAGLKTGVALVCGPVFRVRRVGRRARLPRRGLVLCPNHCSYLDPAFLQLVLRRRVTFVMTNDFYASRWGRWFFTMVGAIPVGRGRLALKGLRRSIAAVRRGHAVVVFPEGRLSVDGTLGRGQRGVGILARRTGAPVYPVGIAGSLAAWPKGRGYPGRAHVRIAFADPLQWPLDTYDSGREAEQAFADAIMGRISRTKAWVERVAPEPRKSGPGRREPPLQNP